MATDIPGRTGAETPYRRRRLPRLGTVCAMLVLVALLALSLAPIAIMLTLSLKTNAAIFTDFWGLPKPPQWLHYIRATRSLWPYLLNTAIVTLIVVPSVLWFASMAGYALARLRFRGREAVYAGVLALLMIPGILTLIPTYALVQAMGLDGADELGIYRHLALPLTVPTLATIAIMTSLGIYNDYIWPLVAISDNALQTFTVGVTRFSGEFNMEYGPTLAGYVVGSIPLVVLFAFGMKAFVKGVTSGALRA